MFKAGYFESNHFLNINIYPHTYDNTAKQQIKTIMVDKHIDEHRLKS